MKNFEMLVAALIVACTVGTAWAQTSVVTERIEQVAPGVTVTTTWSFPNTTKVTTVTPPVRWERPSVTIYTTSSVPSVAVPGVVIVERRLGYPWDQVSALLPPASTIEVTPVPSSTTIVVQPQVVSVVPSGSTYIWQGAAPQYIVPPVEMVEEKRECVEIPTRTYVVRDSGFYYYSYPENQPAEIALTWDLYHHDRYQRGGYYNGYQYYPPVTRRPYIDPHSQPGSEHGGYDGGNHPDRRGGGHSGGGRPDRGGHREGHYSGGGHRR